MQTLCLQVMTSTLQWQGGRQPTNQQENWKYLGNFNEKQYTRKYFL